MKLEDVKVGMSVVWSYLGETDTGVVTDIDGKQYTKTQILDALAKLEGK